MTTKRNRFTASLPPTPCTPEMRERMVAIADQEGKSLADLQRSAMTLFLLRSVSFTEKMVSKTVGDNVEEFNRNVNSSEAINRVESLCQQGLLHMLSDDELRELEQILQQLRDLRVRVSEVLAVPELFP